MISVQEEFQDLQELISKEKLIFYNFFIMSIIGPSIGHPGRAAICKEFYESEFEK